MSELERRLSDALTQGAQDAPVAVGLAGAARSRARRRRRARAAGVATLVALCIGVPTAVVAIRGSDDHRPSPSQVVDDPTRAPSVPAGLRVESWHGVTALVPDSWGHGSLSDWCSGGDELVPRVERPGAIANDILCQPQWDYGLQFQQLPPGQDREQEFDWPVVLQSGGGWPDPGYVGAHGIGDVLVQVTAPSREEALAVLATVHAIGPQGDANGCTSSRGEAPPENVPEGSLRICRYDDDGLLEQSEMLASDDGDRAEAALAAAPAVPDAGACQRDATAVFPVVRLHTSDIHANVDLGGDCPTIHGLGPDRELTADVLYWALSPGWSGSFPDGVPVPKQLRRD